MSSQPNITYLTKFTSRDSYLLISKKANIYFTDSRYIEEAKIGLKGVASIEKINHSVFKQIADICRNLRFKQIGFEEKNLSFDKYKKIKKELSREKKLVATGNLIEVLRQIKESDEIGKIKNATQITIEALKFIKNLIRPERKEIEIAAELEYFIRCNGGQSSAFDIIVASGTNSSFPHHLTSQRKIKNNEIVLIDIGSDYMGYKSDLTRVFFLGKINSLIRNIYDIVVRAQDEAIRKIRPTIPINEVDIAARQYITQNGYGDFFTHSLGHGIGLEVHESPRISSRENALLEKGMVFTIEPAIYLPGKFGIRLEDIILVTQKGRDVISGSLDK